MVESFEVVEQMGPVVEGVFDVVTERLLEPAGRQRGMGGIEGALDVLVGVVEPVVDVLQPIQFLLLSLPLEAEVLAASLEKVLDPVKETGVVLRGRERPGVDELLGDLLL